MGPSRFTSLSPVGCSRLCHETWNFSRRVSTAVAILCIWDVWPCTFKILFTLCPLTTEKIHGISWHNIPSCHSHVLKTATLSSACAHARTVWYLFPMSKRLWSWEHRPTESSCLPFVFHILAVQIWSFPAQASRISRNIQNVLPSSSEVPPWIVLISRCLQLTFLGAHI